MTIIHNNLSLLRLIIRMSLAKVLIKCLNHFHGRFQDTNIVTRLHITHYKHSSLTSYSPFLKSQVSQGTKTNRGSKLNTSYSIIGN